MHLQSPLQCLDRSTGLQDLLGLLEGRETFVISKDGEVKLIFNDQFGPEKCVSQPASFLLVSFHCTTTPYNLSQWAESANCYAGTLRRH